MDRRRFLGRLAAAVVGLTLARELPGIAAGPPKLPTFGVAQHFFKVGDRVTFESEYLPTRLDVIYGWGALRKDYVVTATVTSDG